MYVRFWFQLYLSCLYLCNQRGAFWVQMCPAVHTQWILTRRVLEPYTYIRFQAAQTK